MQKLEKQLQEMHDNVEGQAEERMKEKTKDMQRDFQTSIQEMRSKISSLEQQVVLASGCICLQAWQEYLHLMAAVCALQLSEANSSVENANLSAQSAHENARELWSQLTAAQRQTEELNAKLRDSEVRVSFASFHLLLRCALRSDLAIASVVSRKRYGHLRALWRRQMQPSARSLHSRRHAQGISQLRL